MSQLQLQNSECRIPKILSQSHFECRNFKSFVIICITILQIVIYNSGMKNKFCHHFIHKERKLSVEQGELRAEKL